MATPIETPDQREKKVGSKGRGLGRRMTTASRTMLEAPEANPPRTSATNANVYRQVAELHMACIDQGFLSTLGTRFLALMYEAIDVDEHGILIVCQANGRVQGYVAGTTAVEPLYRYMLRRWPRLISALLPSLWSTRRMWRMLEILGYSIKTKASPSLPAAELLAIAVHPTLRGTGHAATLYEELSDHFRSKGLPEFKFIVGVDLKPAHRFYKAMGAVAVKELEVHGGSLSIAYVQDLYL